MLDHLCNKSKFRLLHMVEIEQCVSKDLTVFILCSTLHGCTLMLLLTDTSYRVGGGFSDLYTLPFLSTNYKLPWLKWGFTTKTQFTQLFEIQIQNPYFFTFSRPYHYLQQAAIYSLPTWCFSTTALPTTQDSLFIYLLLQSTLVTLTVTRIVNCNVGCSTMKTPMT